MTLESKGLLAAWTVYDEPCVSFPIINSILVYPLTLQFGTYLLHMSGRMLGLATNRQIIYHRFNEINENNHKLSLKL